ncbi:hypothetical protein [Candidatus Parabeggiatoa sp. HSG14]|uniref:hypothetical protein n=1 Tax=Candidatus Parabeggiatoa sp. HSG14 TaxID=3055593 RepID=UPI0025A77704|nr:hypothetical protein [Thiotrichales bacterium HSG14]
MPKQILNLPWHQVTTKARLELKEMTTEQVEELAEEMDLYDRKDECWFSIAPMKTLIFQENIPLKILYFGQGLRCLGKWNDRISRSNAPAFPKFILDVKGVQNLFWT